MDFFQSEEFTLIVLPILIFLARIVDVSLGTLRIIFVSKGLKSLAPIIGFFEIFIWIIVVSRVIDNLDNWLGYVAYAGGFAAGNFFGMRLEERLAIGHELIRVITKKEAHELIGILKDKGFGITSIKAMGTDGEVAILYLIINRRNLAKVLELIKDYNPKALYTVEDIRNVSKEIYYGESSVKKIRLFK
ncbi:MAG: DUF2179 domain-containing protein [Bacteroidales bacterium]